jgi:hypothetical protein
MKPILQSLLKTPPYQFVVWFLVFAQLFSEPLKVADYYQTNFERGVYPPYADAISIPLMQFMVGWCITLPFILLLVAFALWEYPGAMPLWAYNWQRPVWSLFWTALVGLLLINQLYNMFWNVVENFPLSVAHDGLTIYVLLCLRTSIIYSSAFTPPQPISH